MFDALYDCNEKTAVIFFHFRDKRIAEITLLKIGLVYVSSTYT